MQRWEYCSLERSFVYYYRTKQSFSFSDDKSPHPHTEEAIAQLGMDGWELVAVTHSDMGSPKYYFFKRPLRESNGE